MLKSYTLYAVNCPSDAIEITATSSIEAIAIASNLTGVKEWRVRSARVALDVLVG